MSTSSSPRGHHWQKDPLLGRRCRRLRWSGKRSAAEGLRREARGERFRLGVTNPAQAWGKALHLLRPTVELRSFQKGGQVLQRPTAILPQRQLGQARKLLRRVAAKEAAKSHRSVGLCRGAILVGALSNKGAGIQARNDHHKVVLSHRGALRRVGGQQRRRGERPDQKQQRKDRQERWERLRARRAVEPWDPHQLAKGSQEDLARALVASSSREAAPGTASSLSGPSQDPLWWEGMESLPLTPREKLRALSRRWWVRKGWTLEGEEDF